MVVAEDEHDPGDISRDIALHKLLWEECLPDSANDLGLVDGTVHWAPKLVQSLPGSRFNEAGTS